MFSRLPFIAGGIRYSCKDQDDELAPFYVKVTNQTTPLFSHDNLTVQLTVRKSVLAEIVYGHVHIEQEPPPKVQPDMSEGSDGESGNGRRDTSNHPQAPPAGWFLS
jgi:hypothetical protein